ncbi:MAG: hypothetical protein ACFFD7_17425 [Candidatus Thorarchaeota archaeon]
MENNENYPLELDQSSVRYCGNCKREYNLNDFIIKYPKPYHPKVLKLWNNQKIKFYCSYCYLLKIIQQIKKEKKSVY